MSEERSVGPEPDDIDTTEDDLEDDLEDDAEDEPEEDEPEPSQELEPEQPAAAPKTSRENVRIRALQRQRKERDAEIARLRAENDRYLAQARAPVQPQVDPYRQAELDRQEAERVAMMAPHEAASYYTNKAKAELRQEMAIGNLRTHDYLDKQAYALFQRDHPEAKGMDAEVERMLQTARADGMNPSRTVIFKMLFGEKTLEQMERQRARQQKVGRRRIASQTTRPGAGRSTAQAPRGRQRNQDAADEEMLRNLTVGDWM